MKFRNKLFHKKGFIFSSRKSMTNTSNIRPLHVLRDWVMNQHMSEAVQDENTITYDGITLQLDMETEFIPRQQNKTVSYTVRQILFLLKNKDLKFSDYINACKKNNINNVFFSDRRDIVEWLDGTKATVQGIVETKEENISVTEPVAEASSAARMAPSQHNEIVLADESTQPQEEISHTKEIEIKIDSIQDTTERKPVIEYEQIRTIDSMLICTHDFSDLIALNDLIKKQDQIIDQEQKNNPHSFNSKIDDGILDHFPRKKSQFQNYIILVTRACSGCINNSNIEEFLTNSNWVKPREEPNKKHFVITHNHQEKMRLYKYDVVSDETLLNESDWKKVVAIFVIGKRWQIKNYRPNEPQELFAKILGIYVGWEQDRPPNDIQTWRIQRFTINQSSRHKDAEAVSNIWHAIEEATETLKKRRND
ncbi:hypothetical protein TRFO_41609 [Tritrichomonas foetus]|uniref:Cell division control protein 73 C-terminal domain-containing protein n=1 Tax=Tritrichomonas foetus TaxID=1144522 RepID=A0A1J4L451_9EUKA|nr:hypothetical protein TRFO_41609 [Tritrichomonas foetus]|eukprot:OHT16756.1 hypothetical protein TRFO_41609 [Tritrichomonas foetus]